MGRNLTLLLLGFIVLGVGTGLYVVVPRVAYLAILLAVVSITLNQSFVREPFRFIAPRMVVGFLLFNVFFVFHSLFHHLETRMYFLHFISLGVFLLTYACGRLVLSDCERGGAQRRGAIVALVAAGALTIMLAGQFGEMLGHIDRRDLGLDGQDGNLLRRPGGFLNPNTTAAIALVFLFIASRMRILFGGHLLIIVLALTTTIVLLSQSRSATLVLLLYFAYMLTQKKFSPFLLLGLVTIAVLWVGMVVNSDDVKALLEATMLRFGGDGSANERLFVLGFGLSEFADAPISGHGYRHLTRLIGFSAHNEIVENLVNFGVVGFLAIGTASVLLYLPTSMLFLFVCVVPMFVFSHNFFETTAFQVALGLALATERVIESASRRNELDSDWRNGSAS